MNPEVKALARKAALGWLRCLFGRHEWVAIQYEKVRCERCGKVKG